VVLVRVAQPGQARLISVSALALRAVFEAPAIVAGLDDVAVMGGPVEQRCGHLGVAEDGRTFAEGNVGGDNHRCLHVEPADEFEQQFTAGLGEGQMPEFIEDDEVGECLIPTNPSKKDSS